MIAGQSESIGISSQRSKYWLRRAYVSSLVEDPLAAALPSARACGVSTIHRGRAPCRALLPDCARVLEVEVCLPVSSGGDASGVRSSASAVVHIRLGR